LAFLYGAPFVCAVSVVGLRVQGFLAAHGVAIGYGYVVAKLLGVRILKGNGLDALMYLFGGEGALAVHELTL
jgi:hypothetical protein